ncbi:MAG: outer membrane protein transport protein [Halioglobus sp.]|nr:outer membrane protein transport protein [Halioglobus sp.]MCB1707457.1 outer membrane protein transport protein [Halioglobus sp.]MCP5123596.1 outer membrane protein transport protein [Pseudomonadales bacterium]MCP5193567.1 outer membrane protein transport protein [Pseudomonadales bacterium]
MDKLKLSGVIIATACAAAPASAGGLWANEFGDFSGGRASAGAAAGVDDAATLFHNPASGTRLKGNQLFTSVGAFLPRTKFDVEYTNPVLGVDNGGSAGVNAPGGSFACVHDLNSDRWSAGLYLGALTGAGLDYNADWTGRYQATRVDMLLATLAPTLGYRLTDRLSVGLSLQFWYSELTQKLKVLTPLPAQPDGRAKLDGDDTGVAYTLGAMYELSDRTRFGLMYQSTLEPSYSGNIEVQPPDLQVSSNTELTLAQYARFAMHHDLDEHWSVDMTLGWDNWSELDNLLISSEAGNAGLPTDWHDTYHYAWGAQYRPSANWSFTGGVAYDTNPVDKKYRVPELPLDRQLRYALGAQYQMIKNLTVGGYINYADLGKARVATRFFGGDYQENGVLQLMMNANWTF